eukprot:TRINITY_DN12127_c0_g1_i4.p3 TRINITY_DN12127_c0_g1~~TRINITY_DN12127_c0_g1_i4.p3  ORF type:complete len:200 (-),score=19.33 TRINITY_DN12127_c0_g1_i4:279-878(-)
MILCTLFGLEETSLDLFISLGVMGGGTGAAVLIQQGTPYFNLFGFSMFIISALTEALRVVLVQLLQGRERYNTTETMIYVSFPSFLLLALMSGVFEGREMAEMGIKIFQIDPVIFYQVGVFSLVTNLACYYAIQYTSSLSLKVSGCVKNLLIIFIGMGQGDQILGTQLFCYSVSTVGFLWFCLIKAGAHVKKKVNGKTQ